MEFISPPHLVVHTHRKRKENVKAVFPGEGSGPLEAPPDPPGGGAARPARVLGHQQGCAPDAQRHGKGRGVRKLSLYAILDTHLAPIHSSLESIQYAALSLPEHYAPDEGERRAEEQKSAPEMNGTLGVKKGRSKLVL